MFVCFSLYLFWLSFISAVADGIINKEYNKSRSQFSGREVEGVCKSKISSQPELLIII